MSIVSKVVGRMDAWKSALTGLGTIRDKFESYVFGRKAVLDAATLEAMYHEDDMASKACDAPAEHMMRRGWKYKGLDDNVVAYLNKEHQRLHTDEKVQESLVWEALFGGSAIFIGADDGRNIESSLDLPSLQKVYFLSSVENRELTPHRWYSDITDEKNGKVAVWRLVQAWMGLAAKAAKDLPDEMAKLQKNQNQLIHETRFVMFEGSLVTKNERQRRNGWGGSVIDKSERALKTFHINWAAVSHIMQDASQGVFKMKDLMLNIGAEGGRERINTRMELIDASRSIARAILLDADTEEFERRDSSMAGLPDLLDRTSSRLASSFSMPVTVLMGISPAGLNATGESDIRNWYDQLSAKQKKKVGPRIKYLSDVLLQQEGSPVKGKQLSYEIEFYPLWQMTEVEESQIRSTNASTDSTYVSAGILTPEQLLRARWTKDGYQYSLAVDPEDNSKETTRLYDLLKEKLEPGERTTDQPEAEVTVDGGWVKDRNARGNILRPKGIKGFFIQKAPRGWSLYEEGGDTAAARDLAEAAQWVEDKSGQRMDAGLEYLGFPIEVDGNSAVVEGKRFVASSTPSAIFQAKDYIKKLVAKGKKPDRDPRDNANGQYAHKNMESLCVQCGHTVGSHTAATSGGLKSCLVCERTHNPKGNEPHRVRTKTGPVPSDET